LLKQLDSATERKGCRVIEKIRVKARVRGRVKLNRSKKEF
jgi:hypothetical protein